MLRTLKRTVIAAYFVVLSFILTGCTVPILGVEISFPEWLPFIGGESRSPVTLSYWGLWEPVSVMQPVFDSYKNQRAFVSVDYQLRDPRQHFETVLSRLSVGNPPDIIRVHSTWLPYLKDGLEPLPDDVMSLTDFVNSVYPVVSEDVIIDGQVYGVPLGIDGLALVYNDNLFRQAGLPGPPSDWDTFREYAKLLTKKNNRGEIIQGGAAMGYADQIEFFSDILGLMFAQSGVGFMNNQGVLSFHNTLSNDGRNLGGEAMRFYTKFSTTEQTYNANWNNSSEAFLEGKVGMVFIPSYRLNDILNSNPPFSVKVAPVPQFPVSEIGERNWANYWVEVVPKAGQRPREAWRLLIHMMNKDGLATLYRNQSDLRGFGEIYPRPDLAQTLANDARVGPYAEQGATYTSWPFADRTHDALLNDKIIEVLAEVVEKTRQNEEGANGALQSAAKDIEEILAQFES